MEGILVPIFICVVLPVAIVAIIYFARTKSESLRSQVLIKAMEVNNNIDTDKLADAFKRPMKTAREMLQQRLLYGCIFTLLTVGLIGAVVYLSVSMPDNSEKLRFFLYLIAAVTFAIGVGNLIVYFVNRKQSDR